MLIGGLMVQAHGMAAGIDVVRPTVDVDMIVLAQLRSDLFGETIQQLRDLGYEFRPPMGAGPAHRFVREQAQVDVGLPDNLGRSDQRRLQGRAVLQIDGGYQAAERVTRLEVAGCPVPMQVPDLLGALILKGAAYMVDSRDPGRHLQDAAVIAAAITDPAGEVPRLKGSDRRRLKALASELTTQGHSAWLPLTEQQRTVGGDTFRILLAPPPSQRPKLKAPHLRVETE